MIGTLSPHPHHPRWRECGRVTTWLAAFSRHSHNNRLIIASLWSSPGFENIYTCFFAKLACFETSVNLVPVLLACDVTRYYLFTILENANQSWDSNPWSPNKLCHLGWLVQCDRISLKVKYRPLSTLWHHQYIFSWSHSGCLSMHVLRINSFTPCLVKRRFFSNSRVL